MADEMLCIFCGWEETDHIHADDSNWIDQKRASTIFPGRKVSLKKCQGFYPENPVLAKELAEKVECGTDD
jgi:hypothetical protein